MKIAKVEDILKNVEECIKNDDPFSLIRFGDGGIKFIHAMLFNDKKQIKQIIEREGLPTDKLDIVLKLWGKYARAANYIDTPEVYFTDKFWPRLKTPVKQITGKTRTRMRMWKELYERAEIYNLNYCNPEVNYLMILDDRMNILDVMKNRKVCIITALRNLHVLLGSNEILVDTFQIAGQYDKHYIKSFDKAIAKIKHDVKKYDLWLIAAGELGRIYTGLIKELGGRAVDIGFVVEYWMGEEIHPRLTRFLIPSEENQFLLTLNEDGLKYSEYI